MTTRAVAWAFDKGQTERASWCAAYKKLTIGPAWMVGAGLSDTPGLAEARLVAMATGDVRPLVLAAHQLDDCTEDMRLALAGMVSLLLQPEDDESTELPVDEPTELPDFETEEIMVARLNHDWCIVEAEGFWILQHRLGDADDWEWAGRFNQKRSLIYAVGHLVDAVDDAATVILDALPETPGTPPS